MASTSQNTQLTISVVEMEAMAAIRTIELSSELGFDIVIFEGDCETVGREGNKVDHNLARYARHITGYYVWMEDIPVHCLNVYQADMP